MSKALQDKLYDKRKAGALEYVLLYNHSRVVLGRSMFAAVGSWAGCDRRAWRSGLLRATLFRAARE